MESDNEIKAISGILSFLEGLDAQARERVFKYVTERLGITTPRTVPRSPDIAATENTSEQPVATVRKNQSFTDIRSLKEEKNPDSAIQMTALVAYYLQEIAGAEERKDSIDVEDIQKYFKQAGFVLPKVPKSALINTKAAGYLESADRGRYKLNPVGYNLVAYGLPPKTRSANAKRPKKQSTKKSKPKKK